MLLTMAAEQSVVWLVGDDGDVALTDALVPLIAQAAEQGRAPELEVIHGSFDVTGVAPDRPCRSDGPSPFAWWVPVGCEANASEPGSVPP